MPKRYVAPAAPVLSVQPVELTFLALLSQPPCKRGRFTLQHGGLDHHDVDSFGGRGGPGSAGRLAHQRL